MVSMNCKIFLKCPKHSVLSNLLRFECFSQLLDGLKMCDKIKKPGLDYFVFLFLSFLGAIEDSGAVWRKKSEHNGPSCFFHVCLGRQKIPLNRKRGSQQERIKKMPEIVEKVMCPFFLLFVRFVSRSLYEQRKPSFSY